MRKKTTLKNIDEHIDPVRVRNRKGNITINVYVNNVSDDDYIEEDEFEYEEDDEVDTQNQNSIYLIVFAAILITLGIIVIAKITQQGI